MLEMKWLFGNKDDLTDAHAIRRSVFIEEQGISEEEEYDDTDVSCIHLVIYEDGIPVSTGRIMVTDDDYVLGRVATLKSHRGRGIATGLMQSLMGACVVMGGNRQILHAQTQVQGFYERLGFTPYGEEFEEAGMPHIAMEHFGPAGGGCGSGGHCGGCQRHEA